MKNFGLNRTDCLENLENHTVKRIINGCFHFQTKIYSLNQTPKNLLRVYSFVQSQFSWID
jgi:hypothetical protein